MIIRFMWNAETDLTRDFTIRGWRHEDDLWQLTTSRLILVLWTVSFITTWHFKVTQLRDSHCKITVDRDRYGMWQAVITDLRTFPCELLTTSLHDLHRPIHRRCSEVATVATVQVSSSSQNVTVGLLLRNNIPTTKWLHMCIDCQAFL